MFIVLTQNNREGCINWRLSTHYLPMPATYPFHVESGVPRVNLLGSVSIFVAIMQGSVEPLKDVPGYNEPANDVVKLSNLG